MRYPTLFESEKHTHQNRLRFRSTVTAVVKLSNIIYNESTRAAKRATAMLVWASLSVRLRYAWCHKSLFHKYKPLIHNYLQTIDSVLQTDAYGCQ